MEELLDEVASNTKDIEADAAAVILSSGDGVFISSVDGSMMYGNCLISELFFVTGILLPIGQISSNLFIF